MDKKEELLEQWRELTPEKQQKVWQFVQILKSESQTTPEAKFIPQTPLSKKLWEIRHRAIAAGLQMDALHVAAALQIQADELITTEKPTKPMHRVREIQIVSIDISFA